MRKGDIDDLLRQLGRNTQYIAYANQWVIQRFEDIKREMIEEFENHPITKEIEDGIGAENISGTLDGITNLYSFIGFYEGDRPIDPIREVLNDITVRKVIGRRATIRYIFDFPSAKDIFKVTPMPWASGRSWAQGIEYGISGIGYYLHKFSPKSRSGYGIQAKKPVRANIRFKNTKYISDLISKYSKKLMMLERETRI